MISPWQNHPDTKKSRTTPLFLGNGSLEGSQAAEQKYESIGRDRERCRDSYVFDPREQEASPAPSLLRNMREWLHKYNFSCAHVLPPLAIQAHRQIWPEDWCRPNKPTGYLLRCDKEAMEVLQQFMVNAQSHFLHLKLVSERTDLLRRQRDAGALRNLENIQKIYTESLHHQFAVQDFVVTHRLNELSSCSPRLTQLTDRTSLLEARIAVLESQTVDSAAKSLGPPADEYVTLAPLPKPKNLVNRTKIRLNSASLHVENFGKQETDRRVYEASKQHFVNCFDEDERTASQKLCREEKIAYSMMQCLRVHDTFCPICSKIRRKEKAKSQMGQMIEHWERQIDREKSSLVVDRSKLYGVALRNHR